MVERLERMDGKLVVLGSLEGARDILRTAIRKGLTGSNTVQMDTFASWFPSYQQGDVKYLIQQMDAEPECPLERMGGSRGVIRLSDYQEAMDLLETITDELGGSLDRWLFDTDG